ncbi:MAG TPA: aminotransferase class IV [Lacipirellulaceae bacterium]|nr:aminotransferase class IV [Lacipirellulaceae bacterium]
MNEPRLRRMANVNGQITPLEDATISILDRGFLYGDSVYEVFRTYSGVPLFCHEHFERMENSARLVHMTISQSREQLLDEMRRTAAAAGAPAGQDIYVRWHVTRGTGSLDLIPARDLKSSYVIIVKEVPQWNPEFYSRGMRLAVTRVRRNPVEALSPDIKSGNYLNNILGVSEAVELGADDCLMLNPNGLVTEASNSNALFVINGKLVTPSVESGVLRGITKAAISRLGANIGFPLQEAKITAADLARATECFVTSATREVMPVVGIRLENGEWREFPPGGGDVTRRVAKAYKDEVSRYVRENSSLRLL